MLRRNLFTSVGLIFTILFLILGDPKTDEPSQLLKQVTTTSEEVLNLNPSLSGDGRFIAFESTLDLAGAGGNGFHAVLADLMSQVPHFVEMGGARAVAPAMSQDGSVVTFSSSGDPLGANADGNSEIFLFRDGGLIQITRTRANENVNRLTDGNFQPSISDDGRYIAFSSNRDLAGENADGNLEIFICDTIDLSITQLTNTSGSPGAWEAKISGDGNIIAYIREGGSVGFELALQDRLRLQAARVVAQDVPTLKMAYGRTISDDGSRIVYSAETSANASQVFLWDGRNQISRQLTFLGTREEDVLLQATISGDGKRVSFATRRAVTDSNSDHSVDLYLIDVPTAHFERVTSAPGRATAEVVSSLNDDGSIVAFSFPRVLTDPNVSADLANNSEVYTTTIAARPQFGDANVLNGASFGREPALDDVIAPSSIAVARGSAFAHTTLEARRMADGKFPLTVAGTSVSVNGHRAQLFYVSPREVHFLVPTETETGLAEITVTNSDGFPSRSTILVRPSSPGIFTSSSESSNEGVILNADTLQCGAFDPGSSNLRLSIFATGVRNAAEVSASIFGRAIPVESVNASQDLPGLDEIHVLVPADFRGTGRVNLTVRADGRDSNSAGLAFVGTATRDVVINEVLADPPDGLAGDSNHDGVRSSSDDEFIELVNHGSAVNLSGWTIRTRTSSNINEITRHVFSSDSFLLSGELIVVFGGGTFDPVDTAFGCAGVVDASSGALSLVNGGLTILIRDSEGNLVAEFTYGGASDLVGDNNQSLTRDPDIVGNFTQHSAAVGANSRRYSPGLTVTGTPFVSCEAPLAIITISPLAADLAIGASAQLVAQPLDTYGRPVPDVNLIFNSNNPSVVSIDSVSVDQVTGAATAIVSGHIAGSAHITAQATSGAATIVSAPAVVSVLPPSSVALVVIRQVYGGGNNSGATFQNDFVELFNRGTTTVDFSVTPYSVQYAPAAGNFSNANKLNLTAGVLAPGQHFLIRLAGGTTNGQALPAADASSASINLSAADGKVALVMGTTLLAGNGCPLNSSIVDFVGYGSANCAEGIAIGTLSATRSARRVSSCVDTNSNSTDFAVVSNPPAPNNSATPVVPCP